MIHRQTVLDLECEESIPMMLNEYVVHNYSIMSKEWVP